MTLTAKELVENSWLVSQDSEDCVCFLDEALQVIQSKDRTIWLARAERANEVVRTVKLVLRHLSPTSKYFDPYITKCGNWQWVERKCREKAEEFK